VSPAVPKPNPKKQRKRFASLRDPEYAAWIRTQPCILIGHDWWEHSRGEYHGTSNCEITVKEACHVRSRGAAGGDHGNVVPMCARMHDQQYILGIRFFQARWKVDLKVEAQRLWERYQASVGKTGG
jgi:hypothetical protein